MKCHMKCEKSLEKIEMFSRILGLTVCEESRRACCSGCQTSCLVYSPGTSEGCFRQIYYRVSLLSFFIQHASWALTAFLTKCIYDFNQSATYFSKLSYSYTFGLPHLALKLFLSHVCWAVMKWWLLFSNPCLWCILPKYFISVLFSLPFEVLCCETLLGYFVDLASWDLFVARGYSAM